MLLQIPPHIRSKVRILVVEDNLLNQKLDAFLLSGWGLKFDICDHAPGAISLLRSTKYDLILMDIRMPAVTGFEATRVIRQDLGLDVPIIGITAYPNDEERTRSLEAGMNNYISKPVDENQLYRLLVSYLVPQEVERMTGEEEK